MSIEDLTRAQAAVTALLPSVAADDWSRPSPCEGWDAADVARHLVAGERSFAASLGGTAPDLPTVAAEVDRLPVTALPAAYAEGADALREALAAADPEAAFRTGLGQMPASVVTILRTVEALAHGWDIARAAGSVGLEVDEDVVERAISRSIALMERLPPDRTPFGAPQPVDDDAPAIDRLAALLGRSVTR